jgi:hypothetical protein
MSSGAVIRAELKGSNRCEALGITAHGSTPVLALCRALIEAGHDPRRPLHVYRAQLLTLAVRSIADGARLATHGVGFERTPGCTGGAPAPQDAPPALGWSGGEDAREGARERQPECRS